MSRLPPVAREAERADLEAVRRFGIVRSLVCFLWPGLIVTGSDSSIP